MAHLNHDLEPQQAHHPSMHLLSRFSAHLPIGAENNSAIKAKKWVCCRVQRAWLIEFEELQSEIEHNSA